MTDVAKYVEVYKNTDILSGKSFFIVDSDRGKGDLSRYLCGQKRVVGGFERYHVTDKVFIILLPGNYAVEDLFIEYDNHLDECIHLLFDETLAPANNVPGDLTRAHSTVRGKPIPLDKDAAKQLIKNENDVKNSFWLKVEKQNLQYDKTHMGALKSLLN